MFLSCNIDPYTHFLYNCPKVLMMDIIFIAKGKFQLKKPLALTKMKLSTAHQCSYQSFFLIETQLIYNVVLVSKTYIVK